MGVLEVWRAEKDLLLSRVDLQHLIQQLFSWCTGGVFIQKALTARVYPAQPTATPGDPKEQKWGEYTVVKKLAVPEREGWRLVPWTGRQSEYAVGGRRGTAFGLGKVRMGM